jgi:hypothetical protein
VLLPMARQECHPRIAHEAHRNEVAGIAVRRFQRHFARVIEQGVEAGATNDSDVRNVLGLDRSSLYSDEVDETTPKFGREYNTTDH